VAKDWSEVVTSAQSLLHKIVPVGDRGLEGLVAVALRDITQCEFRLSKAGYQGGADIAALDPQVGLMVEVKRYQEGRQPSDRELLGTLAQVRRPHAGHPLIWMLAATYPVSNQTVQLLHDEGSVRDIRICIVDWSTIDPIPRLMLLLCMAHDVAAHWIERFSGLPSTDMSKLASALSDCKNHPAYEQSAAKLRSELGSWRIGPHSARSEANGRKTEPAILHDLDQYLNAAIDELARTTNRDTRVISGMRACLSRVRAARIVPDRAPHAITLVSQYIDRQEQDCTSTAVASTMWNPIRQAVAEIAQLAQALGHPVWVPNDWEAENTAPYVILVQNLSQDVEEAIEVIESLSWSAADREKALDLLEILWLELFADPMNLRTLISASAELELLSGTLFPDVIDKCRTILGHKAHMLPPSCVFRLASGAFDFVTVRAPDPGSGVQLDFAITREPLRAKDLSFLMRVANAPNTFKLEVQSEADIIVDFSASTLCEIARVAGEVFGISCGYPGSPHLRTAKLQEDLVRGLKINIDKELCTDLPRAFSRSVRLLCCPKVRLVQAVED